MTISAQSVILAFPNLLKQETGSKIVGGRLGKPDDAAADVMKWVESSAFIELEARKGTGKG